jgi:hypothetical protein
MGQDRRRDPRQGGPQDASRFRRATLAVELSTRELVGGLYLPLAYWKLLETSPEAKGKRGGIAIGYHNAGKWLTSTLFVDLMQRDWLGSARGASAVLREVLRSSLRLKRSTIVALESSRGQRADEAAATDEVSFFDGPAIDVPF